MTVRESATLARRERDMGSSYINAGRQPPTAPTVEGEGAQRPKVQERFGQLLNFSFEKLP